MLNPKMGLKWTYSIVVHVLHNRLISIFSKTTEASTSLIYARGVPICLYTLIGNYVISCCRLGANCINVNFEAYSTYSLVSFHGSSRTPPGVWSANVRCRQLAYQQQPVNQSINRLLLQTFIQNSVVNQLATSVAI